MVVYMRNRPWIAIVIVLGMLALGANLMAQNITIKGKGSYKSLYADHSLITGQAAWITSSSAGFPSLGNKERVNVTDIIISNPSTSNTVVTMTMNGAVLLENLAIGAGSTHAINLNTAIHINNTDQASFVNAGPGDASVNLRGFLAKQ